MVDEYVLAIACPAGGGFATARPMLSGGCGKKPGRHRCRRFRRGEHLCWAKRRACRG